MESVNRVGARFFRAQEGLSILEYSLTVFLVMAIALPGIFAFGKHTKTNIEYVALNLDGGGSTTSMGEPHGRKEIEPLEKPKGSGPK